MRLNANAGRSSLDVLRQFVSKPREQREVCELCAAPLASHHQHLLEIDKSKVACACDPCAILFAGQAGQRYRRIPRDVRRLPEFAMDDHEWKSLLIPINLAYFVYSSSAGQTLAQYPSPGGAMESSLDPEYWNAIVERNPVLRSLEPDVEALLANRLSDPPQYHRVGIDQCFRLVGIIRSNWRGLSGGTEVWEQIDHFFEDLKAMTGEVQRA